MNETLKAVVVEVSGGNVPNHHLNLRGTFGLFSDDCLSGSNEAASGVPVTLELGVETVATDIGETKAIFRERGAIRRFFERDNVAEGDLVLIERLEGRSYRVSKTSRRAFNYHL